MDISPELVSLSSELAIVAGKVTVETIIDKIQTIKKLKNKNESIEGLIEIINGLIDDKNRLIQISRAYEEKLINQKITDTEIDYVTESLIPLIKTMLDGTDNKKELEQQIDIIKSICSKETINILQILGFNFKKAIGEPLTELVASLIESNIPNKKNLELQIAIQNREIEYFKVIQNEEAYNRLLDIMNKK